MDIPVHVVLSRPVPASGQWIAQALQHDVLAFGSSPEAASYSMMAKLHQHLKDDTLLALEPASAVHFEGIVRMIAFGPEVFIGWPHPTDRVRFVKATFLIAKDAT